MNQGNKCKTQVFSRNEKLNSRSNAPRQFCGFALIDQNISNMKMQTKILTAIVMILILETFPFAQQRTRPGTFGTLCNQITLKQNADLKYGEKITREYEVVLWEAAGADLDKDTVEEAVVKIQKWWDIYKRDELNCGGVPILQYAINQQFEGFTFTLIDDYQVDAGFISIYSNNTLLDSLNDYIDRRSVPTYNNPSYMEKLYFLKKMLLERGVKPVSELAKRNRSEWSADLYVYSGKVKFNKFESSDNNGDDFERNYQTIVTEFSKAIEMEPNNALWYVPRAKLNLFAKDNTSRLSSALADLTKVLELNGDDASTYHLRSLANCRLGNKKAARADENKASNLESRYRYGEREGIIDGRYTFKRCQ